MNTLNMYKIQINNKYMYKKYVVTLVWSVVMINQLITTQAT